MNHAHKLAITLFFSAQVIYAQTTAIDWKSDLFGDNAKEHSWWSLTLPVSAGAMGTGTIASQGSLNAADLPFFPANAGLAQRNNFAVTRYNWLMGMNKTYAGVVLPSVRFGTFGLFSNLFSTGSDPQFFTADGVSSRLSLLEYAVGGTFGRSLFDEKLSIGITATYAGNDLDEKKSSTEALSADLLYAPGDRISIRTYVRNIGLEKKSASISPPLQSGAVFSAVVLQAEDQVRGPLNTITVGTGLQKTAENPLLAAISAEWRPLRLLSLRSGYNFVPGNASNTASGSATGLHAGIGLRIMDLSLDAGWQNASEKAGTIWALSAALDVNDFVKRSSDDYVSLAKGSYIHKRYGSSLDYSKKALQQDPGNWMAHNLFRKATSAMKREETSELWILYSGNFKGKFFASDADGSMGGLPRAAAVLKRIRLAVPFSMSIATGNMLTLESPPAFEKVVHDYYTYMVDDDARCIGQGELDYGIDRILTDPSSKPMLCFTAPVSGNEKIVSFIIVKRQACRFAVISAVRNPAIDTLLKQKNSSFPAELSRALGDSTVLDCNLRIAVIHDTWENIEGYGATLQNADVIICASLNDNYVPARRLGASVVVSAPTDGTSIGNLIVRLDDRKRIASYENLWIPLTEDIAPDRLVAAWITTLLPKKAVLRESAAKKRISGDFFAFLHEIDGISNICVKSSGSIDEVSMSGNDTVRGSPSVSLSGGNVAYMRTDKKSGCVPLAVYSLADRVSTTIVADKNVHETSFSPNGKWIYCTASDCGDTITDIFRVRTGGGALYPVVTWKNAIKKELSFSPKSPEMTFCSDRDGSWQIYLTDLEGNRPLRLTDDDNNHRKPLFSPDGKYISYLSNNLNTDGSVDLWIYDRAKANQVRITEKLNAIDYCWLDNSRKLLVSAGLDFPDLKVVDISTGAVSRFLNRPRDATAAPYGERNPRLVRFNGKKKVLYDRDFGDNERVLYWTAVDGSDEEVLVDKE